MIGDKQRVEPDHPVPIAQLDHNAILLIPSHTKVEANPDTDVFVDALSNLIDTKGQSHPSSPSHNSGTSLAIRVVNHTRGQLGFYQCLCTS